MFFKLCLFVVLHTIYCIQINWKIKQKVLGCVCVGILAYHFNDRHLSTQSELFFYLMCVTFLVCTTILLLSCLISWSTGGIISKTIYVSQQQNISIRSCESKSPKEFVIGYCRKSFTIQWLQYWLLCRRWYCWLSSMTRICIVRYINNFWPHP